jgi:hypothetical protein
VLCVTASLCAPQKSRKRGAEEGNIEISVRFYLTTKSLFGQSYIHHIAPADLPYHRHDAHSSPADTSLTTTLHYRSGLQRVNAVRAVDGGYEAITWELSRSALSYKTEDRTQFNLCTLSLVLWSSSIPAEQCLVAVPRGTSRLRSSHDIRSEAGEYSPNM